MHFDHSLRGASSSQMDSSAHSLTLESASAAGASKTTTQEEDLLSALSEDIVPPVIHHGQQHTEFLRVPASSGIDQRGGGGGAGGATQTTSLLKGSRGKERAVSEAGSHLSQLSYVTSGLRKRGETVQSAVSSLHPRSSIAVPRVQASEFMGEASIFSCVVSLSNSMVGAGILGLPYCFAKLGIVPGIIVLMLGCATSLTACLMVMLAAKTINGGTTFSDLGWKTAPRLMPVVELMNFLGNFGTIVAYMVVIGDVAPQTYQRIADVSGGNDDSVFVKRQFLICIYSAVFLLPTIPSSSFDHLKGISTFAIGCFLYIVCVAVLYATVPPLKHELRKDSEVEQEEWHWWPVDSSPTEFLQVVPIVFLAFSASQNAVSITHELRHNTVWRLTLVNLYTFLLCTGVYLVVGLCGYVTFGSDTESNILVNYPKAWLVTVVRFGLSIAVCFSYPMWLHPCRENIAFIFFKRSAVDPLTTRWQYYGITFGLFLSSLAVALITSDLGIVMALSGAVASVMSTMVVPPLMFYYRCTPQGGPFLYSSRGEQSNVFEGFENGIDERPIMISPMIEGVEKPAMDPPPQIKFETSSQKPKMSGDEGEWNIWPAWTIPLSQFLLVCGVLMVPTFVTVQFL